MFPRKQNTNYFDQSEAVKSPINLRCIVVLGTTQLQQPQSTAIRRGNVFEIKTVLTMMPLCHDEQNTRIH